MGWQGVRDGESGVAAALAAGDDERAMEILLREHGEHVYRYCRRMLGNDADGDDVAQTVYVQAVEGLGQLSHVRSVRAWLLGIARHRCLDRLKSSRRRLQVLEHHDLREVIDSSPTEPQLAADPCVRHALDTCLDCLDTRSRVAVVLRFHDELSFDEISALTCDTPGALRIRVTRALAMLRRCVERKAGAP